MQEIYFTYLSGPEIAKLQMTNQEILDAVEQGLRAQGQGQAVLEPRVHLEPDPTFRGHFNVLRGYIAPLHLAGVKVVGDYLDNYKQDLPSEMALLNLFDPHTGMPKAILDATAITAMRTGALTALGAKYLARQDSKILGHIGARGSAYWNVRLLDHLFNFEQIRVHSRRRQSYESFAQRLSQDLGKSVIPVDDWRTCLEGADIMVEASRLMAPQPLFKTEWIGRGALVVPYGTHSAVEMTLTDVMDKVLVDDWAQCAVGNLGALRAHVECGKLGEGNLYAELCEVVAGQKPGRENDTETILLWHRGLSLSDIALGNAMLEKARCLELGESLRFA